MILFNLLDIKFVIFSIRQGKIYHYRAKDYTAQKLIEFAESGYQKQMHPETVPPEYSYM